MPRHFPALGRFQIDETGFQVQPKGQKWAHMDIAGVVWTDKPKPMVGVGATGFAVRSLDKLVQDNYEA